MSVFSSCSSDPPYHITLYAESLSQEDVQRVVAWMGPRRVIYITLSKTGLDDDGAVLLASALKVHRYIRGVDVSSNNIGARGALALAAAIASNSNIDYCYVVDNRIGEGAAAAIDRALSASNREVLEGSQRVTHSTITEIGRHPPLGMRCGIRTVCDFLWHERGVIIMPLLIMPFLLYLFLHPIEEGYPLLPMKEKTCMR